MARSSKTPAPGSDQFTQALQFEAPILELERKIQELEAFSQSTELDLSSQIAQLSEHCRQLKRSIYKGLTPWQRVQIARHPDRPGTLEFIQQLFEDFLELAGDRAFAEDRAIVTGLARLERHRVLIVGHRKGKTTRERIACNFASAHPEGYRKALQKMELAAKFRLPIIAFINTPGAYPGVGAEERGQAQAIARNIIEMCRLPVPIIALVIGEGGSGGALGIGVGDKLLMLENAYYSVISPEGCSAILWKSGDKVEEAATILKLTAEDLFRLGVIDEIVPEPLGGAHRDHPGTMHIVRKVLLRYLAELDPIPPQELLEQRYEKYRRIGEVLEDLGEGEAAPGPARAAGRKVRV